MSLKSWLHKADVRNQEVVDAMSSRVQPTGSGALIENEVPGNGTPRYPSRLSIDGAAPTKLLFGTTFHPMSPGSHRLKFDNGPNWMRFPFGSSRSICVDVPAAPMVVRVLYRSTSLWRRSSSVEVTDGPKE